MGPLNQLNAQLLGENHYFCALMKMRLYIPIVLFVLVFAGTSCKSEFEKVRLSNNPESILEASHKYFEEEEYLRAQTLYELILNQFRGTKEAEQLFFNYAYTHYYLRQYRSASVYFKNFANTFAYSPYREEADYMSAFANYRLSPGYRLDQKPTEEAIEGFQEFVNRYTESERVAQANDLIDEMRKKLEDKSFSQGELYFNLEQYEAAITAFENTLLSFPETDRAAEIRFLVFKSAYQYAERSIYERRAERYEESIKKYNEFISKHARSDFRDEADALYRDAQKALKALKNGRYQNQSSGD